MVKWRRKRRVFPLCSAGCGEVVTADDDLVNISPAMEPAIQVEYGLRPGIAHRSCFEARKVARNAKAEDSCA